VVGMPNRPLLERVVGYLSGEGYAVVVQDGVVRFRREGVGGAAWVVPEDAGLNEIVSSVMGATEYAAAQGVSYVVLPAHLAQRIDESQFWTFGIGLLVYDQHGVEEALHPRSKRGRESEKRLERRPDEGMLERLYGEVKALADRLSRLEAELGRLHELDELSERISKLEKAVMNRKEEVASPARVIVERAATTPRKEPVKIPAELDQMPSFLRDNPWIEVLSQRR